MVINRNPGIRGQCRSNARKASGITYETYQMPVYVRNDTQAKQNQDIPDNALYVGDSVVVMPVQSQDAGDIVILN